MFFNTRSILASFSPSVRWDCGAKAITAIQYSNPGSLAALVGPS